jgi:hypothetical protein
MSAKLRRFLLVTAALICVGLWWVIPRFKSSAAQRSYPLGMALQEARLQLGSPYYVSTNTGVVFPEPTIEQQRDIYPLYFVVAQKEGLYMEFNHHEKLIKLELLTTHK